MTITVQPIRPEERPRCAYCGKGMHPRFPERLRFANEEEFAKATTNRRVYVVRRDWKKRWDGDKWVRNGLFSIEASLFPTDASSWGSDGLFCTGDHAIRFAYAALKAGYRMKAAIAAAKVAETAGIRER